MGGGGQMTATATGRVRANFVRIRRRSASAFRPEAREQDRPVADVRVRRSDGSSIGTKLCRSYAAGMRSDTVAACEIGRAPWASLS